LKSHVATWKRSDTEAAALRQKQHDVKLDTLLTVAAEILNKRGYDGLSLSDVAAAVGVSKQALYYYVRNKEELLFRCYMRQLDAANRSYDIADAEGRSGLEKVIIFARHSHDTTEATLDNLGALSEENRNEVRRRAKALERRMRGFISEGIKDGSIADDVDPKMVEFWILGSLSWLPKWYRPEGEKSMAQVLDSFIEFVCQGLRPRK
jgi:TetR/AcrR family transcriptional regulator